MYCGGKKLKLEKNKNGYHGGMVQWSSYPPYRVGDRRLESYTLFSGLH
jgi:hypothetical protein